MTKEKVLDLDTLLGEEKKIKFGGRQYIIGDIPMVLVLKLSKEERTFESVFEAIFQILDLYNEGVKKEDVEKMSQKQISSLMDFIFEDFKDSEVKKNDEAKPN